MLPWLKLFKRQNYCETTLEATGVLKNFTKIIAKQLRRVSFRYSRRLIANFLLESASATSSNFQWYLVQ